MKFNREATHWEIVLGLLITFYCLSFVLYKIITTKPAF